MSKPIPVIDLFAGPGGLGEGFSSLEGKFRIVVSAEKEAFAHKTLRLRAFKRLLDREGLAQDSYYAYLNGEAGLPHDEGNREIWDKAEEEAQCLTLGQPADDLRLRKILDKTDLGENWVLIGGPPCQAYSLVGRSRNRGIKDYVPEDDNRHFLYREYLKIIQEYRPAVFVMENVKGMLSSTVGGKRIFNQILRDLADPDKALGRKNGQNQGYRIYSLVDDGVCFHSGTDPESVSGDAYTIYSEQYGIPQTRHRVILLGVREDIIKKPSQLKMLPEMTVREVIQGLPKIRSRLSRNTDTPENWLSVVKEASRKISREAEGTQYDFIRGRLDEVQKCWQRDGILPVGGLRVSKSGKPSDESMPKAFGDWVNDPGLRVCLNHDARGHMDTDLTRYLFAACFAEAKSRSPKGHEDFGLDSLRPAHKNWGSGHFADRFRVQVWGEPAKTITSHISKDGHYYIHPDPRQCRSFTVREAARIQSFPDNYLFEGNRTQQFVQVGNAVPPYLARQIAEIVSAVITSDD